MRQSANPSFRAFPAFWVLFVAISATVQSHSSPPPENPADKISKLLQRLTSAPPDTCGGPWAENLDPDQSERSLLEEASNLVLRQLNLGGPELAAASEHATEALDKIKTQSESINATWPQESRFHYELLSIPPALVLKVGIGTHERYFVFGVPAKDDTGKPNRQWQRVGEDDLELDRPVPRNWINIYPLHRGPSGIVRFLASIGFTGCAGSSGLLYDAREWDPNDVVGSSQIIKQEGAMGMDEAFNGGVPNRKEPFAPIGKLDTKGSIIALPYCWFSAIDTWDDPSMCALDTYDLSGDTVKFRSRTYNRPDLLPVAKAIEYAESRDFPAVKGYCASDDVAREIVRVIPPFYFAGDIQVIRERPGRERVTMDSSSDEFEIEKREGRWMVIKFTPGTN
jgi:hypothetical protein